MEDYLGEGRETSKENPSGLSLIQKEKISIFLCNIVFK